jgi:hypothetical protein
MEKIVKFEDFLRSGKNITEEHNEMGSSEHTDEQYYMFFQNLASIKHYIDEIMKYDQSDIDSLLRGGHDWASDHIATSKDDIEEVAGWLRNEMGEDDSEDHHGEIEVNIEGDDDKVEVEDDEEEEEYGDNGDEENEDSEDE